MREAGLYPGTQSTERRMSDQKYKVVRMYFDHEVGAKVIARGLTLEEAQAHCRDKETSSSTCTTTEGRARTEKFGPWFDGYEEE